MDALTIRNKFNTIGGISHWFIEKMGGTMVDSIYYEPDPYSFRGDYYYDTRRNILRHKITKWSQMPHNITEYDEGGDFIILPNNRKIQKLLKQPEPGSFADNYYFDIVNNKLYRKSIFWSNDEINNYISDVNFIWKDGDTYYISSRLYGGAIWYKSTDAIYWYKVAGVDPVPIATIYPDSIKIRNAGTGDVNGMYDAYGDAYKQQES